MHAKTGVFLEEAPQEISDSPWGRCRQRIPCWLFVDDGGEHVGHVVASEDFLSCQRFVETTAKRPDVGSLVDGLASSLFGAHVRSCSHDRTESCALGEGGGL